MAISKKKVSKKVASTKKVDTKKKTAKKKKVSGSKKSVDDLPISGEEVPVKKTAAKEDTVPRDEPVKEEIGAESVEPIDARAKATASRKALLNQLRSDFEAGIDAVLALGDVAKEDLRLIKTAANDEITVLKERVTSALDEEGSFLNITQQKARKVISEGESWGKQQISKLKSAADRAGNKFKK